jgi:anti-sigma factor RsiW
MEQPEDSELSSLIRQHATRHVASDALRASVRAQVALADVGRAAQAQAGRPARWRRWWQDVRLRSASLGFALGTAATLLAVPLVQRLQFMQPLAAELVAGHVQAMRVGPLVAVASSDRHTVKPWYQGRLDYAPPVVDLAAEGFPLLGGRVQAVRGRDVAVLAYARDRHYIDLFVWPAESRRAPQAAVQRGFNVVHWSDGAMEYWAVSDVERGELERFGQALQIATAPPR